jgi:hypothetical protein
MGPPRGLSGVDESSLLQNTYIHTLVENQIEHLVTCRLEWHLLEFLHKRLECEKCPRLCVEIVPTGRYPSRISNVQFGSAPFLRLSDSMLLN